MKQKLLQGGWEGIPNLFMALPVSAGANAQKTVTGKFTGGAAGTPVVGATVTGIS